MDKKSSERIRNNWRVVVECLWIFAAIFYFSLYSYHKINEQGFIEHLMVRVLLISLIFLAFINWKYIAAAVKKNRRAIIGLLIQGLYILFVVIFSSIISSIFVYVLLKTGVIRQFSSHLLVFMIALLSLVGLLCLNIQKKIGLNITLTLIVFIGAGLFAVEPPTFLDNSWDDVTHYGRSLVYSQFGNKTVSKADNTLLATSNKGHVVKNSIVNGEWKYIKDKINHEYLSGKTEEIAAYEFVHVSLIAKVVYTPMSAFLFLGRGLGLKYSDVFILGKLGNVFFFCLLLYFSLRRLKSGKLIVFSVSMFPTVLFMMGSYSYDPWIIAFEILAFSLFAEVMQNEEVKMSFSRAVVICLLLFAGFLAKPVYFPLMLFLFNIPREKLKSNFSMSKYRCVVCVSMLLLILYFVLPFLISGAGGNDTRGGQDVNSIGQISYILSNPLTYTSVLMNEMGILWNPQNAECFTNFLAYLAPPQDNAVFCIIVLLTSFWDRKKCDERCTRWIYKLVLLISAFITTAIVATALYVSFTPVGCNEVNGCSPRYIIPIVLLVLLYLGSYEFKRPLKILDNRYVAGAVNYGLVGYFGLYAMWVVLSRCVVYYLV